MKQTKQIMLTGSPWIFLKIAACSFWAAISGSSVLFLKLEDL